MKRIYLLTVIFLVLANVVTAQSTPSVDTKKSIINWTGHAEIGKYAPAGTLNLKEGEVSKNGNAISGARLVIDMKSMKQANDQLLEHLKSADFFDVEKYAVSIIKIDKINNGIAYGQLTVKDKTLNFQCPIVIKKEGDFTIVSGNAIIDRTKFGIIYNSGNFFSGLGDKAIRNTFDIDFSIVLHN